MTIQQQQIVALVNKIGLNSWGEIEKVHPGILTLKDEQDLIIEALRDSKVRRAILDVFKVEAGKRHHERSMRALDNAQSKSQARRISA